MSPCAAGMEEVEKIRSEIEPGKKEWVVAKVLLRFGVISHSPTLAVLVRNFLEIIKK